MKQTFQPNSPAVASEVIDGEAVIMHLKSGKYYSAAASGGFIWRCIERQQPLDHVATLFAQQYAATPAQATAAVEAFVKQLMAEDLIREAGSVAIERVGLAEVGDAAARKTFVGPTLNVYSDMQDLLLLDPIHDVDEVGWPTPATSAKN